MKFNELSHMMQKPEPKPDTYEAGMALNQLLKIGTHAIKIHNMIDDRAEMEAWVAKKIDLASNYVKSVHGYTAGQKAGTYDDNGMTESREQIGDYAREIKSGRIVRIVDYTDDDEGIYTISYGDGKGENDVTAKDLKFLDQTGGDQEEIGKFDEDAGEGHMSKSQLYQTAKMSIELLDMINKGDDLEGWVQTKLNLAADYLQAVYHYEDYQKLSPYREELDSALVQRHAGVIQKHLDEILSKETETADVDTKPGMMRILKKRVNEVEKEIAKENRKNTDEGDMEQDKSNPIAKPYLNKPEWKALHDMDDKIIHAYLKHKEHKTNETALDEGKLKDWAKSLAMAGVFVAGMAGVGSIQDAINNSVPAIQAMNTALEMAQERGDDNLVAQIEKDIKDAKLRLDIGRDLNQVKYLQDKYEKFIQTESLAYESKLAVQLNQQLK